MSTLIIIWQIFAEKLLKLLERAKNVTSRDLKQLRALSLPILVKHLQSTTLIWSEDPRGQELP